MADRRRRSLTTLLLRVREKIRRDFLPVLAEFKLSNQQWRILRLLYDNGPSGVTQIADECALMQPSVVKMIPRLEAQGLVRRHKVASDRRRTDVDITDRGRELVEKILPILDRRYEQLEKKLGEEMLDRLCSVLDEVDAKL
jgi:homoprotocatechuate degradation regulator HpaR